MAERKKQKRPAVSLLLIVITTAGLAAGFHFSGKFRQQEHFRLQVLFTDKAGGREHKTTIFGISSNQITRLVKRIQKRGLFPEKMTISGVLWVNEPGMYSLAFAANRSARFFIDGRRAAQTAVLKRDSSRVSQVELGAGSRAFTLEFLPAVRNPYLGLLWRTERDDRFSSIQSSRIFSPDTVEYSPDKIRSLRAEAERLLFLKNAGFVTATAAPVILIILTAAGFREKREPLPHPSEVRAPAGKSRLIEIDKTKGFAGFLMVAAHISSGRLLPFGTFGAALFFLCSGMNTILFLVRTHQKRHYNYYHLFFGILLFTGGYTQIVIAHPGNPRMMPEFLQVSALSILLIFGLSQLFKTLYHVGFLFPVPFLLHFLFMEGVIRMPQAAGALASFFFNPGAFPLFPWAGFFLYGVFLLYLHKRKGALLSLSAGTGLLAGVSIYFLRIPVEKWGMSLSYVFLSLFAVTVLFALFYLLTVQRCGEVCKSVNSILEVVGRNSLMFVYVHYLAADMIQPKNVLGYPLLDLGLSALLAFLFTAFIVYYYERTKYDEALFLPLLLFFLLLLAIRYGHFLAPAAELKWIDIFIGMAFAFLYVKLRRKLRPGRVKYVPF